MYLDKEKLKISISLWEEKIKGYSLPSWEHLPTIDLYMDQVLSLLEHYLGIYYEMADSQKFIPASMINNYVKLGVVPKPYKKRYHGKTDEG